MFPCSLCSEPVMQRNMASHEQHEVRRSFNRTLTCPHLALFPLLYDHTAVSTPPGAVQVRRLHDGPRAEHGGAPAELSSALPVRQPHKKGSVRNYWRKAHISS